MPVRSVPVGTCRSLHAIRQFEMDLALIQNEKTPGPPRHVHWHCPSEHKPKLGQRHPAPVCHHTSNKEFPQPGADRPHLPLTGAGATELNI